MNHRSRRAFLRDTAILGSALGFPGLIHARPGEDGGSTWEPRLALSSVMFSGLSLADVCAQAAKLGFRGIDLWGPFGNCRHMAEAMELGADGFHRLLEKHDLEVASWTTYRTKVDAQGFPGFAEFIGACGGGVVVRESKYADIAKDGLEDALRAFFKELQPEIDLARKHKVRLAIENHGGAILNRPESFQIFTRLNPAPEVVGIALAPYHLQQRGTDVAAAIRTCGKQLLFFYAWQSQDGVNQLPGHGPADFGPWLRALAAEDYRHWMTPFMHGELPADEMAAAVARAAQYLNSQAKQEKP